MLTDTEELVAGDADGLARLARAELKRRGRSDEDIEAAVEERLENADE